jgi:HAD superfamily hydrolase (TIGR01509 family)
MFSALIFDCDGTLIDSMPAHYVAWRATLDAVGIDFPEHRFYQLAGTPTDRIIELLANEQSIAVDVNALAIRKEQAYLDGLHRIAPIPSVVNVVREHLGRLPMAVASGGFRDVVLRQLEQIGLHQVFDAIVCAEDTPRYKPHPDVFLEAARRLGVSPSECCVYEDADLGLEAARRAGMAMVDIRTWHTPAPAMVRPRT